MPWPAELYLSRIENKSRLTSTDTGEYDLQAILDGKDYFVMPSSRVEKPKKLILTDWTAQRWSFEKMAAVLRTFAELMDEGFDFYIAQYDAIVFLPKRSLQNLKLMEVCHKIVVQERKKIISEAISLLRVSHEAVDVMRKKSAETIRVRVNVYHSTRDRIYDCI